MVLSRSEAWDFLPNQLEGVHEPHIDVVKPVFLLTSCPVLKHLQSFSSVIAGGIYLYKEISRREVPNIFMGIQTGDNLI